MKALGDTPGSHLAVGARHLSLSSFVLVASAKGPWVPVREHGSAGALGSVTDRIHLPTGTDAGE